MSFYDVLSFGHYSNPPRPEISLTINVSSSRISSLQVFLKIIFLLNLGDLCDWCIFESTIDQPNRTVQRAWNIRAFCFPVAVHHYLRSGIGVLLFHMTDK